MVVFTKSNTALLFFAICYLVAFNAANTAFSQDKPIITIDPGRLVFDPVVPAQDAELTVFVEGSDSLQEIAGLVTHPYGEGPFNILIEDAELVMNVTAEFTGESIRFALQLNGVAIQERTALVRFRPLAGDDETIFNALRRVNAFESDYPHEIEWLESEALDSNGQPVSAIFNRDSMINFTDFGGLTIWYSGFDAPISEARLVGINNAPLYPGIQLRTMNHSLSLFIEGFSSWPYLPVTYRIVLENGSEHIIAHPGGPGRHEITPSSAFHDWSHFK